MDSHSVFALFFFHGRESGFTVCNPGELNTGNRMMENETLEIRVLFFAMAHELAGESSIELSLPAPATAGDAEDALKKRYEWLGERLSSYRIAVDEEFGGKDTPLRDGSELAIIPPVSGG